jgi:hypothetical protein
MTALFLALVLALQPVPTSPLLQAKDLTYQKDYEASLVRLKGFAPTNEQYNEYCFLMAVNYFALNNKIEAQKWVWNLKESFRPLERRHLAMALFMERDLQDWKKDDLGDIERDMRMSADKLDLARAGKDTQKIQQDIVAKLDKLIKEKEDGGKGSKSEQDAQAGKDKQGPGNGKPNSPAPDSIVMGGTGSGKVDDKKLKEVAEQWGTLPPEKRAKVVQEITRDLPEKFRPMIEEYFKALNRVHNK